MGGEIYSSIELSEVSQLHERLAQYQTMQPGHEVLGFYSIDGKISDDKFQNVLNEGILLRFSSSSRDFMTICDLHDTSRELQFEIDAAHAEIESLVLKNLFDLNETNSEGEKFGSMTELQLFVLNCMHSKVQAIREYLVGCGARVDYGVLQEVSSFISKVNYKSARTEHSLVSAENSFKLVVSLVSMKKNLATLQKIETDLKSFDHSV